MREEIVGYFNNYSQETIADCEEKYAKYKDILINKPKYTAEEADLWFAFMRDCNENFLLSYYALQRVCETLMGIYIDNDPAVRLGGTPDNALLLLPHTRQDGSETYLAHAYTNNFNVMEWDLEIFGIDVTTWDLLISDKKTDRVLRSGVAWNSPVYIVTILANLRTIPTDQIKTKRIH